MATGNEYRKVRALLAKTVKAGCTEDEAVSALETALRLIVKFGLDEAKLTIMAPPGYRIDGQTVTKVASAADTAKPTRKPKKQPKATAAPKPKGPTVGDRLAEMAKRPRGFTLEEVMTEFGVLAHSARAMVSTELRKKRGLNVTSKAGQYRVAAPAT